MRYSLLGLAFGALWLTTCGESVPGDSEAPRVIVLGFDGMDPKFVKRHADRLPNLMKLAETGGFVPLETVMPPQSPVAWSTVITGMTPGGHGVFDFVHRRPDTVQPFSSMAEAIPPSYVLRVGKYQFPLDGGETRPLRRGKPFWAYLEEAGVDATIMRMPTDFPPHAAADHALSGMGAPDMLGSFGTFQFFTTDPEEVSRGQVSGGEFYPAKRVDDVVTFEIRGPVNTFLHGEPRSMSPVTVYVDPDHPAARIEIGDEVAVLNEGEWSDWMHVDFELVPYLKSARGIVRLYVKEVDPEFRLYVSPVNVDPAAQEIPVTHPLEFGSWLTNALGPFYTQGMAEETKGLSAHVLDRDEFATQAHLVFDEAIEMYEHLLSTYRGGFLFYYFSTTDQAAHMLYGDFEDMLVPVYEKADRVVGETLERIEQLDADGKQTTLIVISDHGFQRFDREVHLNTWLMEEGYLVLTSPDATGPEPGFRNVDWSRTRAYAMGLNGLYLNRRGREKHGIVAQEQVEPLQDELERKLLSFTDPDTGEHVVQRVYESRDFFQGNAFEFAPDLLVGFAPPYRMSPETGLGAVPDVTVEDNEDEWIGDHCMAHETVPGVLLSNRPITRDEPTLADIPATVLRAYGLELPPEMVGKSVFE